MAHVKAQAAAAQAFDYGTVASGSSSNAESPVVPASGIAGALAIRAARGNAEILRHLPLKTGRKLVVFPRQAGHEPLRTLRAMGGFKIISTADVKNSILTDKAIGDADCVYFDKLGVALIKPRPGVTAFALPASGGAIANTFDERIVYALGNWYQTAKLKYRRPDAPSGEYSRGFRDGVLSTSELLDSPPSSIPRSASTKSTFDESQATWGLQVTKVINS
jgi:hypothetical protein